MTEKLLTVAELEELAAKEKAATEGEWHAYHHEGYGWRMDAERLGIFAGDWNEADAEFVAALRNAAPALLHQARLAIDLLEALPRCDYCEHAGVHPPRIATRCDSNCSNVCEDDEHGAFVETAGFDYDMPWAKVVRRLHPGATLGEGEKRS